MKTNRPIIKRITNAALRGKFRAAFTLIELLVVITIIAILAGIALPVFNSVQTKGQQTKALSNAKQIGLALRMYASDNNGIYPSLTTSNGVATTATVTDSNTAFAQLFPTYCQQEAIFWLSKSPACNAAPPDEQTDPAGTDHRLTLATGENEWAYVVGLDDRSNPAVPLLVDAFTSPFSHNYTTDTAKVGSVWKGANAIVVRVDNSGAVLKLSVAQDYTIVGPNASDGGAQGDIFTTSNAFKGWLSTQNSVVNPLTP